MSLASPQAPFLNSTAKATGYGLAVNVDENSTRVNQIHGINPNNANGAGIPKQVTNVQVLVANAQAGATCTVSVLFKQNPTDTSFSGVNVWVRGYQGNAQLVQVASGTASPCKFVLNNTGETVAFTIQAFGNGGNAPLNQSPTSSAILPKSVSGGFGSSTTVYTNTPTDVDTPALPERFDYLFARGDGLNALPNATFETFSASASNFSPTATETSGRLLTGSSTASTSTTINVGYNYGANLGQGFVSIGSTKMWGCRIMTQTGSNCRYWLGLMDGFAGAMQGANAGFAQDIINGKYVAFRYSDGTDTTWKLAAGTDNTHQSVSDTGIPISTSASTFFELVVNGNGTSVDGYINGQKVATVSSNLPLASYNVGECVVADNKNTATAINLVFFWMQTVY